MADDVRHPFEDEASDLVHSSDRQIEDAVQQANPMALRGLLYQLTGDPALETLRVEQQHVRTSLLMMLTDPVEVAGVRANAVDFLKRHRDAGAPKIALDTQRLRRSMELTVAADIPDIEVEMWVEQSGLSPWARTFSWDDIVPTAPDAASFTVAVIGVGMAGLNAALSLRRANIPYFVLEKNADIGGTWFENRYPGARVDSASRCYCFVHSADYSFPSTFCTRDENFQHLDWVAQQNGLRENVSFETEVVSLTFEDERNRWKIVTTSPAGEETRYANAVISCVGLLNRPNLPDISGMDSFAGPSFHTARWPAELDFAGKRIALIGTGASGYQLAPELGRTAAHLSIFQRTPSWCFDTPGYLAPLSSHVAWLDRNIPFYPNYARLYESWLTHPKNMPMRVHIDPTFDDPHALSQHNRNVRDQRVAFVTSKLKDKPELIERMIPKSPPMSTRHVFVDPDYSIFDILNSGKASLVSDPITRITETGVETSDGKRHEVDIIVYATGYKVNEFLWPMELRGRGGRSVGDLWAKDGARAYLGSMLPGFPNFFMVYGPNSNNWAGLQIVDFHELVTRFAVSCIAGLIARHEHTVEPTEDAYWRYNEEVDRCEAKMLYSDKRANSYYRNAHGRSAANSPIDIRRIWRWTRNPLVPRSDKPEFEMREEIRPFFGEDLVVD